MHSHLTTHSKVLISTSVRCLTVLQCSLIILYSLKVQIYSVTSQHSQNGATCASLWSYQHVTLAALGGGANCLLPALLSVLNFASWREFHCPLPLSPFFFCVDFAINRYYQTSIRIADLSSKIVQPLNMQLPWRRPQPLKFSCPLATVQSLLMVPTHSLQTSRTLLFLREPTGSLKRTPL